MAYDEHLAARVRSLLGDAEDVVEQRMFGGLAFLCGGSMAVAVSGKGGLMVRVDPAETDVLLREPGAGPFHMRDKPVDGWLRVDADAVRDGAALAAWVQRGAAYARSLT